MEALKKDHEQTLQKLALSGKTNRGRIVGLETFEDFAKHYRSFVSQESTVPERKQMVQKFIRKIEVGTETVKIHFIVDEEHFKRELAAKESSSRSFRSAASSSDFFKDYGSNTLTFGAL